MATTGIINGTLLRLYIGGVAFTKATECTIQIDTTTRTTTHKDSASFEESLAGINSWTMTTNGLHAFDSAYTIDDLIDLQLAQTTVTARFSTEVSGDRYYEGTAVITSCGVSASVEENVTFSVSLKGSGTLTAATTV